VFVFKPKNRFVWLCASNRQLPFVHGTRLLLPAKNLFEQNQVNSTFCCIMLHLNDSSAKTALFMPRALNPFHPKSVSEIG
jgi:hypothetical protein